HIYYTLAGDFTIAGFTIRDHGEIGFDVSGGYGISACASGTIRDNIFQSNQKAIGALCSNTVLHIENNIIFGSNMGIVTWYAPSIEVRHNTMANNYEQIRIGYWRAGPSSIAIAHNIIVNGHWGIRADSSAVLSISCNDVWNNAGGNYLDYVSDRTGVEGNISVDPLFCSDYYLHLGSPCLGANVPETCDGEHMGHFPIACEVGTERTPWGKIKNLFDR
ncbi:MAG: right-handed parallel beta-helix repeat-containing protein, partial [Candidatus Krumholzibacteriia bacterium]